MLETEEDADSSSDCELLADVLVVTEKESEDVILSSSVMEGDVDSVGLHVVDGDRVAVGLLDVVGDSDALGDCVMERDGEGDVVGESESDVVGVSDIV